MAPSESRSFDPEGFAREWIAAWNDRDIERVVSHFEPDAAFRSPRAAEITGNALVWGRDALRAYWSAAAGRVAHLHFTLDSIIWDGGRHLVIVYDSEVGDRRRRACEFYEINTATHLARSGEAMYGADVP